MTLKRGDSLSWDITYKNSNDNRIDLTGYTIKCQAKVSDSILFDLYIGNGITITDASQGEFKVEILDTRNFGLATYDVDIQYTNPSGFIASSKTFPLTIAKDITT